MNFWNILKLVFELFGIWADIRRTRADKQQLIIDALKVAQNRSSLALGISDKVDELREELKTEIEKEKENGQQKTQ